MGRVVWIKENKMSQKLTVVIIVYNEEKNIREAILSAKLLGADVLVIDSASADNTKKIAESLGAKVVESGIQKDFAAKRNLAKKYATTPWLFHLDADERVTEELAVAVKKAVEGEFYIYEIKRVTTSLGGAHKFGSLSPDYVRRLMPREAEWIGKVHEHPECNCKTRRLSGYITHEPYENWSTWLEKVENYSTIWATDAHKKGKKATALTPFCRAAFGFIKMYLIKGGCLDGILGLNMSIAHAFYTFMKYIKLLELRK
ncbi:MAG: glycosyltransferase family 2 protein [Selenomonadaceae bacterium]|nr:glycosyltransferase family 2 protein [Selenomonadaceae bacterium]